MPPLSVPLVARPCFTDAATEEQRTCPVSMTRIMGTKKERWEKEETLPEPGRLPPNENQILEKRKDENGGVGDKQIYTFLLESCPSCTLNRLGFEVVSCQRFVFKCIQIYRNKLTYESVIGEY